MTVRLAGLRVADVPVEASRANEGGDQGVIEHLELSPASRR